MSAEIIRTLYWDGGLDGSAQILDQALLPIEIKYIECQDHRRVCDTIRDLNIRGAPAIGIATAMGVALGARELKAVSFEEFAKGLEKVFEDLLSTRPTAVNIRWAVERARALLDKNRDKTPDELKALLKKDAESVLEEDIEINRALGRWGSLFIRDGDSVLTHCNAGSLATGGYGTATSAIYMAKEQGKNIHVFVDETRPVLQGARLTAWELMQADVPCTLITDNSAGSLMRRGEIDLAIVGTDRTVRNGDVANKIGTYPVAVLCREHGIPFYVAAPLSSIDFSMAHGDLIPIENRHAEEVTMFKDRRIAPENVTVRNLAFDVTPAKYVTAIITELGPFRPRDIRKLTTQGLNLDELRYTGKGVRWVKEP